MRPDGGSIPWLVTCWPGLLRVAEATRTALEVDGAAPTLVHEDGPPRWVAATDAAMELLEQIQHDFGEGPCLQAYSQNEPVAVADLRAAPVRARIDAVVSQLHVSAVLSVPVRWPTSRLAPWTPTPPSRGPGPPMKLEAAAEFAAVAGELVHASVELATRELKLAQEVVQDAQRQRLAALALDDTRVLEAETRAQAAEQALQAELTQRRAALERAQVAAAERNHAADERDRVAGERDRTAGHRTDRGVLAPAQRPLEECGSMRPPERVLPRSGLRAGASGEAEAGDLFGLSAGGDPGGQRLAGGSSGRPRRGCRRPAAHHRHRPHPEARTAHTTRQAEPDRLGGDQVALDQPLGHLHPGFGGQPGREHHRSRVQLAGGDPDPHDAATAHLEVGHGHAGGNGPGPAGQGRRQPQGMRAGPVAGQQPGRHRDQFRDQLGHLVAVEQLHLRPRFSSGRSVRQQQQPRVPLRPQRSVPVLIELRYSARLARANAMKAGGSLSWRSSGASAPPTPPEAAAPSVPCRPSDGG
jgi:hypothetical protein